MLQLPCPCLCPRTDAGLHLACQRGCAATHLVSCFFCILCTHADENEGQVILPHPDELAVNQRAGLGAHDSNSSTPSGWFGGIVAPNALYDGTVIAVVDNIQTAEACCRVTQEWNGSDELGHPNLFNWCPANSTEDCTYVYTLRLTLGHNKGDVHAPCSSAGCPGLNEACALGWLPFHLVPLPFLLSWPLSVVQVRLN